MITRKEIVLPSGGKCIIRKISAQDCAKYMGEIPMAMLEGAKDAKPEKMSPQQVAFGVKMARIAILECCSAITWKGRRLKVVDKEMDLCQPTEITIGELDDADAQMIVNEVMNLTNLTREAAEKAKPFPQEQKTDGATPPAGPALRDTTDRAAETVPG